MEYLGLALLGLVLWFVIWTVLVILRAVWRMLTFDVFGIYYDDPTSPYYHDRHGKGRGHR